jgi:hypothetical protein
MKNRNALKNQTTRRNLLSAYATALAVAFTVSLPQPARAHRITPPPVPTTDIQVPEGNEAFLVGHAFGTQNYICRPSGSGFKFVLFTPQATLFNDADRQLITHFFSPNPFEANTDPTVVAEGMIRATWQHSRDSSTVWAQLAAPPAFVKPDAIPWLLLQVPPAGGVQDGPTGGDTLSKTTFIQRVNTVGGVAPLEGCTSFMDVGNEAFVQYEADYFFYKNAKDHTNHGD